MGKTPLETFYTPRPHNKFFSQNDSSEKALSEIPQNLKIEKVPEAPSTDLSTFILGKVLYTENLGPEMYAWFSSKKKFRTVYDSFVWKNGEVEEKERIRVNPPPHFSEFARLIGTTANTLKRWAKLHASFGEYYDACQDIIQEFLIDNGVTGEYSSQFTIFAAKNTTKMKDVQENINKNISFKDMLDAIEKGKADENDF